VRIDMVERIARGGHEAIAKNERYDVTSPFIVSLGLSEKLFNHIMRNAGFRPITPAPAETPVVAEYSAPAETDTAIAVQGDPETPPMPTELPPLSPPDVHPGSTPDETPVLPDEPAPAVPPAETPPLIPEETPAPPVEPPASPEAEVAESAEGEAQAEPQGANWVFRGRYKPRERSVGGGRNDARQSRPAHHPSGKQGGKPRKQDGRQARENKPGRFSRPEKAADRPAGGGAFAGLAELLGRND